MTDINSSEHTCDHHHDNDGLVSQTVTDLFEAATIAVDGAVKDPVCGMTVKLGNNKPSLKYNGDEFIYERSVEESGWWTRFKKWLSDFFKDLFDFFLRDSFTPHKNAPTHCENE